MTDQDQVEDRIRRAMTGYLTAQPEPVDRWADVVTAAGRARARRRTGAATLGLAALASVILLVGNPARDPSTTERVETAPATTPPAPPARSGDWDDHLFNRPVLWPFRTPEEAQRWEQDSTRSRPSAYATLLTRAGAGPDGPWQVVGTDPGADPDLEITAGDASVPGAIRVTGVITGVDESLRVQVRQPSSPEPLGESCCTGAGGRKQPWNATVITKPATDPVLTGKATWAPTRPSAFSCPTARGSGHPDGAELDAHPYP